MDLTSNIINMSIANSAQQVGDAIAISTLKMAMDMQAQNAAALLAAVPPPVGNSGHNINVRV